MIFGLGAVFLGVVVLALTHFSAEAQFTIRPTYNLGLCVGLSGPYNANQLELVTCAGGSMINWAFNSHGYIGSVDVPGKCMDKQGGLNVTIGNTATQAVAIWDCNNGGTQLWKYDDGQLKYVYDNRYALNVIGSNFQAGSLMYVYYTDPDNVGNLFTIV